MESLYGSQTSLREVQGSVLAEKNAKNAQLGMEEEFVQLSRQPLEILCGGQPSIGEAKGGEKNGKNRHLSQLGKEEKSKACEACKT